MNLKLCIRPNLTIAPFCKDTNTVCSFIIASTTNKVYLNIMVEQVCSYMALLEAKGK